MKHLFFIGTLLLTLTVSSISLAADSLVSAYKLTGSWHTLQREDLEALLPLKTGSIFKEDSLNEATIRLERTGLFQHVAVTNEGQGNHISLLYQLDEARLIRKVDIRGNYPFLSNKIMRLSSLKPGEPFIESQIPESEKRIKAFFEKKGYFNTAVDISSTHDPHKFVTNLIIEIKKGETHRLGEVVVEGNHHFSTKYFENKLSSFLHFKLDRIKRTLREIQTHYQKDGFVRSRVRLLSYILNPTTNKIDLKIDVAEKQKLNVTFVNNHWFKPQTLKNYVTFYKERGYGRFAVQRSQELLLDFYRLNGFLQTQIEADIHNSDKDITVTFTISEGPRTRIKRVNFEGNDSISKNNLLDVMKIDEHTLTQQGVLREDLIPIDLSSIESFYHQEGFRKAHILDWNIQYNHFEDQAILTIKIDEGPQYNLSTIQIQGVSEAHKDKVNKLVKLKRGKPYLSTKAIKVIEELASYYKKQGYPYIDVALHEDIDDQNHLVHLTYEIDEGIPAKIGHIVVKGDYLVHQKVILSAIKLKTGVPYRYADILNAQLNLKKLGIFDHARIETYGLLDKRDTIDLLVKVQERKSVTVDIQAGFDSDKLASGQLLISKRMLFGEALQFQFRGIGGIELDRGEATFYAPRILGASWNLVTQAFAQYEDNENFNAYSYGGSIGTLKHFGPRWTVLLKGQVERFNILENRSNRIALRNNLFDNTFMEYSASAAFDTRDNYADPHNGLYVLVNTEFDTDLSDARNNFNISEINIAHYMTFLKRLTLINTFRLGKLSRISKTPVIPANKLYFMGGNDTVRGFNEDAIDASGGTTSVIYNAELHFRLFDAFKLAGFVDMGSLTETFDEINKTTVRESAGFGLRYITPVGPIRLDYGFILDKKPNEPGQRFHFSFGYFF